MSLPFFAYVSVITAAALAHRSAVARPAPSQPGPARFRFVIPAHDEEGTIRSTVESCKAVAYDPALVTVCVIADNCSDETAAVARDAGAVVLERSDPARRSKGHALEYFFDHVAAEGPGGDYDAAVVIDADTVVDPGILADFAVALAEGEDWIQCYYTVRNPDASWRTRLMTYALSLFNGVWLLGQERMGLGVGLKGNGMCFAGRGLRRHPWRAYGLTEDLEFSWMLRIAGERIHFRPEVRVYGEMVSRGGPDAAAQRRRWEAGRRSLRGKFLRPLLRSRQINSYQKVMYLIDLLFPPLVPLLFALLAAAGIHLGPLLGARIPPWPKWLAPAHGLMATSLVCYALSPFIIMGLPVRYLSSLLALPYYGVWKTVVALGGRPVQWVRTRRESEARGAGR